MGSKIRTVGDVKKLIGESPALLLYISKAGCNVCRELKPKIIKLLSGNFPKMRFRYIDLEKVKGVSGEFSVFAVPAILIYFEGKEFIREGRNLGMKQLREKIERPYAMLFH